MEPPPPDSMFGFKIGGCINVEAPSCKVRALGVLSLSKVTGTSFQGTNAATLVVALSTTPLFKSPSLQVPEHKLNQAYNQKLWPQKYRVAPQHSGNSCTP